MRILFCGLKFIIALTVGLVLMVSAGSAEDKHAPVDMAGWSMADEHWNPEEMARARTAVLKEHGASRTYFVQAERLEYRSGEGAPHFLWDLQGWYGGDKNKIWIKSEGEYSFDEDVFEGAEVQVLWSRAVSRFFDLQAGYRRDFAPGPDRNFAVVGIQGLAPYWFEVDTAAYISGDGDLSARFEAEYEILLTQRLILQPRTELIFAAQDVPENEIGSGLSSAEIGLRLRYEIKRELAPYLGVSWERAVGNTADLVRADGGDPSTVSLVAGVRVWF